MMTKCYFCRGKIEPRKVDVDFRWGRTLKVIRDVPAGVCRQCGERYFEAAVYKEMEKLGASQESRKSGWRSMCCNSGRRRRVVRDSSNV